MEVTMTMPPSRYTRRSALRIGSLGIVSVVTGCAASNDDESASQTTPGETTASTETTGASETQTVTSNTLSVGETAMGEEGVSVTISAPRVRKIIFTPDEGVSTHSYPAGATETQFLTLSVSAQGTDIASVHLDPVLDGTRRESRPYHHTYSPGSSGVLSFQVPVVQAERGEIEWRPSSDEHYQWTLPNSVVTAIGSSPRFEVVEFNVPNTISRGNPFTASLTVRNTGDRDGRFLGVILTEGASSVPLVEKFTLPVHAGETVTHNLTGRPLDLERSGMTAILDWGLAQQRTSLSIVE